MQVYCFCVPFCWSHDKSHTGLTRRRASECRSRPGETHNSLPKSRSIPGLSVVRMQTTTGWPDESMIPTQPVMTYNIPTPQETERRHPKQKPRSNPGLSLWWHDADMLPDILLLIPTNWDSINFWISSFGARWVSYALLSSVFNDSVTCRKSVTASYPLIGSTLG